MQDKSEFARYFREIQPKFSRLYAGLLTEARLSLPQYALLNLLVSRGVIPMRGAAAELHITKPAVTNLVDRLEKGRYLRRVPHPKDRRVSLLEIQPKGRRVVQDAQSYVLGLLLKTLGGFSAREKGVVSRFYSLLSKNMDEVLARRKRGIAR
jgi:DNA-binding MarR family transcriptional regulator